MNDKKRSRDGLRAIVFAMALAVIAAPTGSASADAVAAPDAAALENQKAKLSYAIGMSLGKQLRDQSVEVDLDLLVQGLGDARSGGETLLTIQELRAVLGYFQRDQRRKQAALRRGAARNGGNEVQAVAEGSEKAAAGATGLADIEVAFKLDPRLTRGIYMGDRWMSPPTFTTTVQQGNELTLEARAQGIDANGRRMSVSPQWTTADAEMVAVSPSQGDAVKIVVRCAGQSGMKVSASDFSKSLSIKTLCEDDTIQAEISQ